MSDYQLVIIGGGLSGLASGIRAARFGIHTLILEQHSRPGGLNSWYRRQGYLLETGLHAMTNFAPPADRKAPLNRLLRQLKLSRKQFITRPQLGSLIRFPGCSLRFSNETELLRSEVAQRFPGSKENFDRLLRWLDSYDPFSVTSWRSARKFLAGILADPLLENMLLLPLMIYGNAQEQDMDLAQFAIMFRAIYLEGFFRPNETIREFLDCLLDQYGKFGGEIRFRADVQQILTQNDRVTGVRLENGRTITADVVFSTVGLPGTCELTGWRQTENMRGRMSFMESIYLVSGKREQTLVPGTTILFYSEKEDWQYVRPGTLIDPSWGVVCFPRRFEGLDHASEPAELRVTHGANYRLWRDVARDPDRYRRAKEECLERSRAVVEKIIGNYAADIVYQDSFTPMTIERFTRKHGGAVYGSPRKIRDGRTPWRNLFLAGTDQGYLGIVGAMLSGVTMVNQHLLMADAFQGS